MLFDFHLGGYASLYLNASFNTFQNKYSLQNYFRFPLLEEGNHACCCFSFSLFSQNKFLILYLFLIK